MAKRSVYEERASSTAVTVFSVAYQSRSVMLRDGRR
jgi:hypothetical protein